MVCAFVRRDLIYCFSSKFSFLWPRYRSVSQLLFFIGILLSWPRYWTVSQLRSQPYFHQVETIVLDQLFPLTECSLAKEGTCLVFTMLLCHFFSTSRPDYSKHDSSLHRMFCVCRGELKASWLQLDFNINFTARTLLHIAHGAKLRWLQIRSWRWNEIFFREQLDWRLGITLGDCSSKGKDSAHECSIPRK